MSFIINNFAEVSLNIIKTDPKLSKHDLQNIKNLKINQSCNINIDNNIANIKRIK